MITVKLHENVNQYGEFQFAWAIYEHVNITEPQEEILSALKEEEEKIRTHFKIEGITAHPGVQCS